MLQSYKFKKNLKIITLLSVFALFLLLQVYLSPLVVAKRVAAQSSSLSNSAFSFNNDLKLGDTSEDVRQLQKILNKDGTTLVANSGPGSLGNETTYFGALTKWAVIAFQEKYASEILVPSGLSAGTGFVGPSTRAKLNSLRQTSGQIISPPAAPPVSSPTPPNSVNQSGLSTSVSAIPSFFPQKISLLNISKYQVSPGETIIVSGSGFSGSGNFLHIGDGRAVPLVPPAASSTGVGSAPTPASAGLSVFQAIIPADISTNKYEVWVTKGENGFGSDSSKSISIPFFILVTNTPREAPTIISISSSPSNPNGEIIISGSGFTSSGNNIYSTLGNVLNLSSSGGTITVRISDFPAFGGIKKMVGTNTVEVEGWIYVQNENGVNNNPAAFKVKI